MHTANLFPNRSYQMGMCLWIPKSSFAKSDNHDIPMAKGPYRPNAIRQRDANFQFLKTNKTVSG
jgi:hypothetical protein